MTAEQIRTAVEQMVQEIAGENAPYVMFYMDDDIKTAIRWNEQGKQEWFEHHMKVRIPEHIKEHHERRLTPATAKVGDGATVVFYSDRHSGTIVKVTKSTITIRRDKATLDPSFKPEIIAGGFAGHCVNQNEQTYTYEPDENGELHTLHWSKKYNSYGRPNDLRAIKGRHEFYDYNF